MHVRVSVRSVHGANEAPSRSPQPLHPEPVFLLNALLLLNVVCVRVFCYYRRACVRVLVRYDDGRLACERS